MTRRQRLLAGVLALLAGLTGLAACQSGKSGKSVDPNTLIFGAEQEPPALNDWTNTGNTVWTGIVTAPVLGSLLIYTPDFQYAPQLLASMPTLTSTSPQTVHYEILPNAVWEDGSPIMADDVQYTLDQVLNENNDIVSRIGYDKIVGGKLSNVSSDKKQFDLVFTHQFAPWRELFTSSNQALIKKAAMEGKDFNNALNDTIPFSSGPYKIGTWTKGQQLTLVANDRYWGKKPSIKTIVFKFQPDTNTQLKSLEAQEVQAIYPQPQTEIIKQLQAITNAAYKVDFGPQWEHIDFNLQNPLLKDKAVRKALIYMVDRDAVVARIAKPIAPDAAALQNIIYVPNQKEYKAAGWTTYTQNYQMADQLLTGAGFTKGPDGIYQKNGRPLAFKISTTSGNKARELTEQILIDEWKKGGVNVTTDNVAASELFQRVPQCQYEIILFAYQAGPDPFGANPVYSGDQISCPGPDGGVQGGQNTTAYNNPEVTDLLKKTDVELNPQARADLYNQVNVLVSEDPPTLPLYQKANMLAYDKSVSGMTPNSTTEGPSWNAQDWAIK